TGAQNAYFPLFIPQSFIKKESEHVAGFSPELALVTHAGGKKLEEPLVVRPTSETVINAMFAKWIKSWRDLPLQINQWCNIVRWELRTRLFLRTSEFLWQEGHTAHATEEEAREETVRMLKVYQKFAENWIGLPVLTGEKTPAQRFPGAVNTYCIEGMMQDRKALQAGTSHFLGQNFAKASGIKFQDANGVEQLAWTTSWGVSTRLVGGLIMTHGDDDGLVLPPRLAPIQVVILPVLHKPEARAQVLEYCEKLAHELRAVSYEDRPLAVELDVRDLPGADKMWGWIKKGVPIRVEVGPRDIAQDAVFIAHRTKSGKEKFSQPRAQFVADVTRQLEEIQSTLLARAQAFRTEHTRTIDSREEFIQYFTPRNAEQPEIHGGFALCHWSGDPKVEEEIQKELGVTVRCIPLDAPHEDGKCVWSGQPSTRRVVFAKAY
ncbi:MAG: proline--tRNA ligase, partial [Planctomycetota bacterium]